MDTIFFKFRECIRSDVVVVHSLIQIKKDSTNLEKRNLWQ